MTRNAIGRRESAQAMVAAANARFESALEGFKQGLVDMPGLVLARSARAQAERTLALAAEEVGDEASIEELIRAALRSLAS